MLRYTFDYVTIEEKDSLEMRDIVVANKILSFSLEVRDGLNSTFYVFMTVMISAFVMI